MRIIHDHRSIAHLLYADYTVGGSLQSHNETVHEDPTKNSFSTFSIFNFTCPPSDLYCCFMPPLSTEPFTYFKVELERGFVVAASCESFSFTMNLIVCFKAASFRLTITRFFFN